MFQNTRLLPSASLAVDLFFMLSGFVIAHAYGGRINTSEGWKKYLIHRIVRIYPTFVFGILIGVPIFLGMIVAGKTNIPAQNIIGYATLNLFFLPAFHPFYTNTMGGLFRTVGEIFPENPPSWSLFFEMVVNLFFPLLFKLKINDLRRVIVYSLLAFIIFCISIGIRNHDFTGIFGGGWGADNFICGIPRVLFGFSLGVLLYRINDSGIVFGLSQKIGIETVKPVYLYLITIFIFFPIDAFFGFYSIFSIVIVLPLVVLFGSRMSVKNDYSKMCAQWLGSLSFPIYCVHFPVGRMFNLISTYYSMPEWVVDIEAVSTTLLIAYLLAEFYEPFIKRFIRRSLHLK